MPKTASTLALLLTTLVVAPAAGASPGSTADRSADAWHRISGKPASAHRGAEFAVQPDRFKAFDLDRAALRSVLDEAPDGRGVFAEGSLVLSLPAPSGGFDRFAVHRSAVMEPGLAAQHPEIQTFSGTGIDVPGSTVHLDLGSLGLHASVLGPEGAWYIDPYFHREQSAYVSYFGRDLTKNPHGKFVERGFGKAGDPFSDFSPTPEVAPATVQLRTYRLALVSDPAYASYFGQANVTAAKVALINRVNQPYENDFGIHLTLIADNDLLNFNTDEQLTGNNGACGTAPCYTDAQTQFCSGATLVRTKTVIGQIIGAGDYDIGHIGMGVNGGGIAALNVVGRANKAMGCTGIPVPEGDLFAIDYVAHEIGHQFGGNHTFNGRRYACRGGNRNPSTSVEPGSGSTIMAYAGICLQDDLQPHSDPYFSQRSIEEMGDYVTSSRSPDDEVQNVALRAFHHDGDSFTLTYNGVTSDPIVRGTNYNAASIEAEIEAIAGGNETVVGFGGVGQPDDKGFQVTFGGSLADQATKLLRVTDNVSVIGFVGETVRGGPVENGGYTVVDTGNHVPVVSAPASFRIPVRTPFRLTGGSTDADGDQVTYTWEQNDIGGDLGTALVNNTKRHGPLFRQFGTAAIVSFDDSLQSPSPGQNAATTDPTRIFPDMAQIIAGTTNAATGSCPDPGQGTVAPATVDCYSEFLPTPDWVGVERDRTLHFRLTARDGNAVAGGVASADTALRVVPQAGPFRVTSQATPGSATGGSQLGVSWDPAGTNAAPIDASQVNIRLSLDRGKTFPHVLAAATPNDGSQTVTLPNTTASHARIKVEAVGNVFFDISHANLTITPQDDNDGDGVSNADDACPSLPGPAPSGCPEVTRTVTMRYSTSSDAFRGMIESGENACVSHQRVAVWRERPAGDIMIGFDETSDAGVFALPVSNPPAGDYQARITETVVGGVANCSTARSPLVTID